MGSRVIAMRFGNVSAQRDKIFIIKGGSNLKKSTKRLISSILTAAMLLTSAYAGPVYAADEQVGTVEAYATATSWSADDLALENPLTASPDLGEMFSYTPASTKSKVTTNDKVFADGATFSNRLQVGGKGTPGGEGSFTVTAPSAGTLTVYFVTGSNADPRTINFYSSDAATILASATSGPIADATTYVYEPAVFPVPAAGTYYVAAPDAAVNFYGMTFAAEGGETPVETTTEAPTEATTEAPTEATTEAPTEATTEAPVVAGNGFDATALTAAADKEALTSDEIAGTGFSVEGTVQKRTSSTGGVASVELAKDAGGALVFEAKAGDQLVFDYSSTGTANESSVSVVDASGAAIFTQTVIGSSNGRTTGTVDIPADGTYKIVSTAGFTARGARVYAASIVSGGDTPVEPPTEATTEAPTEAPTETPTEAPTEATTETPAPSGSYAYIPSVPIASGATAYDDANASIVAMQNLDITANTEGAVTIGDNSYTTNLVSTSTNTQLNVDGSSGNYRVAFSVTAKTDITVKVDVKVGAGKEVYLTAGPVTAGSTCSAIDGRNNVTADTYTTLTADVAAGDTIYFVGKGTNAPVYGVDIIAKGGSTTPTEATTEAPTETTTVASVETTTEAPTETTTTAPVAGTINIGASVEGVASDAGSQTLAADAVGTTVKVNIDLSGVEGTAGYNNYTFFIKYNPSVLKAVSVAEPSDLSGYSLANGAVVYDAAAIANSISYVPSATNADYTDVNADGTKTAADLGKIKIANYLDGNSTVATTSGTLVALNFEVVGAGSSDLEIVLVENGIFAAPGANAEITAVASTNTVVVEGEVTTETSTSEVPTETSTSEIPTETTTSEVPTETSTSEPITAPEGTLGVGITPNGNVTANVGDTITFNVDVANAEEVPFNNYTFFISYDPNVIEAVQAVNPTNPATVDGTPAYTLVFNLNGVDNSINYRPSATNPDFANLGADGVKTAAQLGKIKIADYVGEDGVTLVNNSGTLMSIQFVVKAEGDTKLTITKVDNGFYGAVGSEIIDVMPINNTITITSGDEPGPEPAPGIAGDVNMDGNITADDASFTLQKTLNNAFELPCQTAYPDTYMLIVDVNNDGNITADDASYILQKTLNNAFDFPIDAVRGE